MSDPNTEARGKIASAIVYAVRQALEAMQIEATAAQEARKEALANRLDRDQFAAKWATLKGECHAQNQRANQAEKDNAELLRLLDAMREDLKGSELCRDQLRRDLASVTQANIDNAAERDKALEAYATLRESMRPHPDHARLAELEARNVELRQMLEQSQQDREMDVIRLERDRDGFRKGAQYWMDLANVRVSERDKARDERDVAEAKVVKLRTVLQNAISDPFNASLNTINHVLEQTK